MKVALVITTIIAISVCLCDATGIRSRRRRSISESTRFHNEYDNSDRRVHHPKHIDNANEFSVSPASPTQNCVPGSRWKEDCNSCFCTDKGFAACTLMGCSGFNNNNHNQLRPNTNFVNLNTQHREPQNRLRRSENNIEEVQQSTPPTTNCEPGTRWKKDCNTCFCTETGVGVCTLMGCLNFVFKPHSQLTSNRNRRSSSSMTRAQNSTIGNETKCKHGTFRMEECNRCRCLRGRYACTRMMCPPGEKRTNMRTNIVSENNSKI